MRKRQDLFQLTESELQDYLWKVRRRRKLRNRLILLIPSFCIILFFAIPYHVIVSAAEKEPQDKRPFKYYTSVMVGYGESLIGIAQNYMNDYYESSGEYIKEVIKINHLSGTEVKAGQYLIVPYYSDDFIK